MKLSRRTFFKAIGLGASVAAVPALARVNPALEPAGIVGRAEHKAAQASLNKALSDHPLFRGDLGRYDGFRIIEPQPGAIVVTYSLDGRAHRIDMDLPDNFEAGDIVNIGHIPAGARDLHVLMPATTAPNLRTTFSVG